MEGRDGLILSARFREILIDLLAQHVPEARVWAYGSRVTGNAHEGIDLDIVLLHKTTREAPVEGKHELIDALEQSLLPILIDVTEWRDLPDWLHREIERRHVVLREPATGPRQFALEDDFCDVISKAAKGTKQSVSSIARELRLPAEITAAWFVGQAEPETERIDALAALLRLNARALRASLRRSWSPRTALPHNVDGYIQHSHPESNGYLITSDNGMEIAVIDPAGDEHTLKQRIDASGLPLRYLFVTHRHNDHAEAAAALLATYPAAVLIMNEIEAVTRAELPPRSRVIADGDRIAFGATEVEARFTPGHTDGSTCFLFPGSIAVGDTMFAGSVGGNFGPTAGYDEQLRNIRARIMSLHGETVILPGHGPATTVALEREHNPFLAS